MNFFIDTQFNEYSKKNIFGSSVQTIDMLSIAIVSEGNEIINFFNKDFNVKDAWNKTDNGEYWLRKNVLKPVWEKLAKDHNINVVRYNPIKKLQKKFSCKSLTKLLKIYGYSKETIAINVRDFIYSCNENINPNYILNFNEMIEKYPINFYGYYSSYDWVNFCWLFGKMIDLPKGFPMHCNDLKQIIDINANKISKQSKPEAGIQKGLETIKAHVKYPQKECEFNSIVNANWNKKLYEFIKQYQ